MDLFELAVQQYLARDRGIFLAPQYLIGERNVWEGCLDFLAINFPNDQIWMVEVTKAPASKIMSKRKLFVEEYVPRIRSQLVAHRVIGSDRDWKFGLWLFVPERSVDKFLTPQDSSLRVTSLEEAVFPNDDPYRS